jgi:membrane associated rhomboid family serine protease
LERLLAKLDRRYGKYAIENLTAVIVGGMALAFVASLARPAFLGMLTLDLDMVGPPHWQVWRLVSYMFLPIEAPIWALAFELYIFWLMGSSMERQWGAFKLNLYYVIGMIGTTIGAAVLGASAGNVYLVASVLLGFATLFPDYRLYLFFLLPVKVKWLGLFAAAGMAYVVVMGSNAARVAIVASMGNYLLFFGGHLWGLWQGRNLQVRQAARRKSMEVAAPVPTGGRTCAICAAREDDGTDIRICSCEKCGGKPRALCLAHARNH